MTIVTIIAGPTGSGKSAAALQLAESQPIEIISADSRQMIRHLDIGTAKPTAAEQKRIPFHQVDIIEPGERYSAVKFIEAADLAIDGVLARDSRPLVVGGTGLYLKALQDGVIEIEEESDGEIREELEADLKRLGAGQLHQRLMKVDPEEAAKVHTNNHVRLVRALEINALTGKTKTELVATSAYKKSMYSFAGHLLIPPREALYQAIDTRVDYMMSAGLMAELESLVEQGMAERIRQANVIGYAELLSCLDGAYELHEAVEQIKQNSRRYAKRQMTWFRHQTDWPVYESIDALCEGVTGRSPEV